MLKYAPVRRITQANTPQGYILGIVRLSSIKIREENTMWKQVILPRNKSHTLLGELLDELSSEKTIGIGLRW